MNFEQTGSGGYSRRCGWLAFVLSVLLAACGGGGGGDATTAAQGSGALSEGTPTAILTGTAATGGPISGTVTLKDASAAGRTLNKATASDGSFSFDVTGLTAPFLLKVVYGGASAPSALYSIATAAGTANITPLTSIAARAAIGGADLESFFRNSTPADIAAAGARIPGAVAALSGALSPLLQRFDVQGDLLSTPFTADHVGVDAMMDAITVDFRGALVTVDARSSGMNLFSAPAADPGAGSFSVANLEQMDMPAPAPGGALYTLLCAGCHGALSDSTKKDISLARLQTAIAINAGGMQSLSQLSPADMQSIVAALGSVTPAVPGTLPTTPGTTPPPPPTPPPSATPDGAALYASSCAGCHGVLATSAKLGATSVRIQNAISGGTGGMGALSSLTAPDVQAIAVALAAQTPVPAPGPAPTPNPTPTPPDGAALYASSCAGCHGQLGSSTKQGVSIARLQSAIANGTGGMGTLSSLSVTDVQAIVTALTPGTPTPTPVPPPAAQDGPTLYGSYCASCHGALANSTKGRASASSIQAAIAANTGGMGSLGSLQSTQVSAIASALAMISPATVACGSCHAIPPAVGEHGEHSRFACSSCHGVGYGTATVNPATHGNGVVDLASSVGWAASTGSCANGCHGRESWIESEAD